MRCAVLLLALLVSGVPSGAMAATAATLCVKPGVPICMADGTTFVSAERMSLCQSEVKDYIEKTMTYLHCLNAENVATGQEMTRNVERFNCHLSGGKDCG